MFGIKLIEQYVEEKISDYGASTIMSLVAASPVGAAFEAMNRYSEFIESEGVSELDRLAAGEIQNLTKPLRFKFKGQPLLRKMQDVFSSPVSQRKKTWQRGGWAGSREDWLSNAWQHDWRSQPRNPAGGAQHWSGAWIMGRLPYPALTARQVGRGKSRTSRRLRLRNKYRRIGKAAARKAVSSWRNDGN